MQRFVYQPTVKAFIRLESQNRVIDVSNDIINGSVTRRLSAMSEATLTLQNKDSRYANGDSATTPAARITPMDRIAIYLGRVGPTMLSFSGFVDSAPYFQLYPGPVTVKASCTLKLLQHTYLDPGLPFLTQYFANLGWIYNPETGELFDGPGGRTQGGFGNFDVNGGVADVIYNVMSDIGNWPAGTVNIFNLPTGLLEAMAKSFKAANLERKEEYDQLLKRIGKILQPSADNSVSPTTGTTPSTANPATGNIAPEKVARLALDAGFTADQAVIAVAIAYAESSLVTDGVGRNDAPGTTPGYFGTYDLGIWQINSKNLDSDLYNLPVLGSGNGLQKIGNTTPAQQAILKTMFDPTLNAAKAFALYKSSIAGGYDGFRPWATYNDKLHLKYMHLAANAVKNAAGIDPSSTSTDPVETDTTQDNNTPRQTKETIATRVLRIAAAEAAKGVKEIPKGSNLGPDVEKYQAFTNGGKGYPWCAAFVTWVFSKAGLNVKSIVDGPSFAHAYNKFPKVTTFPKPADLVLYRTSDGNTSNDHIGIVTSTLGNEITTIEGNTSDGVNFRKLTWPPSSDYYYVNMPVGIADPSAISNPLNGDGISGSGNSTGGIEGGSSVSSSQAFEIGLQAAWYTLQLQTTDIVTSSTLTGSRALANDVPLFEWIDSMVKSTGRVYSSLPNGQFVAFYPDRFGWFKRTPYLRVSDLELIDLTVEQSDMNLTTHVFASGSQAGLGISDLISGYPMVASIEDQGAFKEFLGIDPANPLGEPGQRTMSEFLTKYGARPYLYNLPEIRHPLLLWMAAWQKFTELWSQQFTTNASFTFLPEILPGGLIALGDRITMFVEEVTHTFDRDGGFSTSASLSSPARIGNNVNFAQLPQSQPDIINEKIIDSQKSKIKESQDLAESIRTQRNG